MGYYKIALACMLCQMFGAALFGLYGFFVDPISLHFGVSKTTIGFGPTLMFLCLALFNPIIGWQLDRLPIKNIMLAGIGVAGFSLMSMSIAPSLSMLTALYLLFCCGFLGYGVVVCNSLITKTYRQHLPRALAISAIGISLGGVLLPLLVAYLIEHFQWQNTLLIVGSILLLTLSTVVYLLIEAPKPPAKDSLDMGSVESAVNASVPKQQPLKHKAFWLIGISFALLMSVSIVNAFAMIPHFQQLGYQTRDAALFYSSAGLAGFCGKSLFAWLSDRLVARVKLAITTVIVSGAIGYYLVATGTSLFPLALGCLLIGFCVGTSLPMQPFLNSLYFDRAIAGSVNGWQVPLLLPFGMVVAPLSGWVFDTMGSYSMAFIGTGIITLSSLILLMFLPTIKLKHYEN